MTRSSLLFQKALVVNRDQQQKAKSADLRSRSRDFEDDQGKKIFLLKHCINGRSKGCDALAVFQPCACTSHADNPQQTIRLGSKNLLHVRGATTERKPIIGHQNYLELGSLGGPLPSWLIHFRSSQVKSILSTQIKISPPTPALARWMSSMDRWS